MSRRDYRIPFYLRFTKCPNFSEIGFVFKSFHEVLNKIAFCLIFRKYIDSSTPNLHFQSICEFCWTNCRATWLLWSDWRSVSGLGDKDKDLASVERCLAEPLLLLCEQQVGDKRLWLLPQTQWQEGETLRHTAERALASLPGNMNCLDEDAVFLCSSSVFHHSLWNIIEQKSSKTKMKPFPLFFWHLINLLKMYFS